MLKKRLVVNLLWRNGFIAQSVNYKITNIVGDLKISIEFFNAWDADEIVLLNVSRDPETRAAFLNSVRLVCRHCFLPLTVGGWVDTVDYAQELIGNGADKLVVNTAGFERPSFFGELAGQFGSQCVVASIDVRAGADGRRTVFVDRGRNDTGRTPVEAARLAIASGAGELLLNSIDRDGSLKGYDLALIEEVAGAVNAPVIAFGGVGAFDHLVDGAAAGADAVAAGNIFHFTEQSTRAAKKALRAAGVRVR